MYTFFDPAYKPPSIALSNSNLTAETTDTSDQYTVTGTTGRSTGKRYFEIRFDQYNSTADNFWVDIGLMFLSSPESATAPFSSPPGTTSGDEGCIFEWGYYWSGYRESFAGSSSGWTDYTSVMPVPDVTTATNKRLCVFVDFDLGYFYFRHEDTVGWIGGGDPDTGTSPTGTFEPRALSPLCLYVSLFDCKVTLFTKAADFTETVPSTATAWDVVVSSSPITLDRNYSCDQDVAFSNGDLTFDVAVHNFTDDHDARATVGKTGKLYWEGEVEYLPLNNGWSEFGFSDAIMRQFDYGNYPGAFYNSACLEVAEWGSAGSSDDVWVYYKDGTDSHFDSYFADQPSQGDFLKAAVDTDAGKGWLGYSGFGSGWLGGGDPATGTSPTVTFDPGTTIVPNLSVNNTRIRMNFGAEAFAFAVPSGYSAYDGPAAPSETVVGYLHTSATLGQHLIWTRPPNWVDGVVERMEWRTDVMTKVYGSEDRRSLRLTPRKEIEFKIAVFDDQRRILENQIFAWGVRDWWMPVWYDGQCLPEDVAAADTTINLKADTDYRDFAVGGYALLLRDVTTFALVKIASKTNSSITLEEAVGSDWGRGSRIYPVKSARIETEVRALKHHSNLSEMVVKARITEPNNWAAFDGTGTGEVLYKGTPLLNLIPEDSTNPQYGFARMFSLLDTGIGKDYIEDLSNKSVLTQSHKWLLSGKAEADRFRRLVYWMRGKHRKVWLPSYKSDVIPNVAADAADTTVTINYQGYADMVDGAYNRTDLQFLWRDASPQYLTISGSTPIDLTQETLQLSAGLAHDWAGPEDALASFMMLARCTADSIDIMHHHEELMEANLLFKSVPASGVPYFPDYVINEFPGFSTDSLDIIVMQGGAGFLLLNYVPSDNAYEVIAENTTDEFYYDTRPFMLLGDLIMQIRYAVGAPAIRAYRPNGSGGFTLLDTIEHGGGTNRYIAHAKLTENRFVAFHISGSSTDYELHLYSWNGVSFSLLYTLPLDETRGKPDYLTACKTLHGTAVFIIGHGWMKVTLDEEFDELSIEYVADTSNTFSDMSYLGAYDIALSNGRIYSFEGVALTQLQATDDATDGCAFDGSRIYYVSDNPSQYRLRTDPYTLTVDALGLTHLSWPGAAWGHVFIAGDSDPDFPSSILRWNTGTEVYDRIKTSFAFDQWAPLSDPANLVTTVTRERTGVPDSYFSYIMTSNYTSPGQTLINYCQYFGDSNEVAILSSLEIPYEGYQRSRIVNAGNYLIICSMCEFANPGAGPYGGIRAFKLDASGNLEQRALYGHPDSSNGFTDPVKEAVYSDMVFDAATNRVFFVYQDSDWDYPYKLVALHWDEGTETFTFLGDYALDVGFINISLTFYHELPALVLHNGYIVMAARNSVTNGTEVVGFVFDGVNFILRDQMHFEVDDFYRPLRRKMHSLNGLIFTGSSIFSEDGSALGLPILEFDGTTLTLWGKAPKPTAEDGADLVPFPTSEPGVKAILAVNAWADSHQLILYKLFDDGTTTVLQTITGAVSAFDDTLLAAGSNRLYLVAINYDEVVRENGVYTFDAATGITKLCNLGGKPTNTIFLSHPPLPADLIEHPRLTP